MKVIKTAQYDRKHAASPPVKLDKKVRRKANDEMKAAGLDENGYFANHNMALSKAQEILQNNGMEIDGIIDSMAFTQPDGQKFYPVRYAPTTDAFTPGDQIANTQLAFSWHKINVKGKEYCKSLAYLTGQVQGEPMKIIATKKYSKIARSVEDGLSIGTETIDMQEPKNYSNVPIPNGRVVFNVVLGRFEVYMGNFRYPLVVNPTDIPVIFKDNGINENAASRENLWDTNNPSAPANTMTQQMNQSGGDRARPVEIAGG